MSLADDFLDLETELADLFGQSAILSVPNGDYDTDGTVTEDIASYAVVVTGPVTESKRYIDTGTATVVTATFYVPSAGLTVTPSQGNRITIGSRVWSVVAVEPATVGDTVTGYRIDCGEVVDG